MAYDFKRWAARGTLVIFAGVSLVIIAQTLRRMAFIVQHGGMDCATCDGSPVAFLIGWSVELFVLAIALRLSWLAWRYLHHVTKAI